MYMLKLLVNIKCVAFMYSDRYNILETFDIIGYNIRNYLLIFKCP